jgi:putative DNA-invertase from lambdoid prophage Rac
LQRILKGARKGAFDVLLVWKLDRLGRSVLDVLANVRQLTDAGITVHVTSQGLTCRPGGDAMSNLLLTILGAVAEFERDLIRDRTRLGMARVKREGSRSGRPIGRPRKGDAPSPSTVERARASGLSWRAVAAELACTVASARRAVGAGR